MATAEQEGWQQRMIRRHHVWGWCGLFVFVALGTFLDSLHGFKIGFYLDPMRDSSYRIVRCPNCGEELMDRTHNRLRHLQDYDNFLNARRFLWTLAHRHGTLLALVHLAFAYALRLGLLIAVPRIRLAGYFLINAIVLMPLGFFLGGVNPSEGDPGVGIWLVPVGGLFLLIAVGLIALEALARRNGAQLGHGAAEQTG
jgi:hypothetical protein